MSSGRRTGTNNHERKPAGFEPKSRGPKKTFDGILGPAPPELERKPSSLKRAATNIRKLVVGRTPEERSAKLEKKRTAELTRLFTEVGRQRAAEARAFRLRRLRETAVQTGSIDWDSLEELAKSELVYLNPRPTRKSRFEGDDYTLADGLVARLSGRLHDGVFIFLGRNKNLYIGSHNLGRGASRVSSKAEGQYSEYRELARAYYQLCR
ncbi:hypothetical protein E0Z10_g3816 [Xylaria hypoxylon]|uniref:Uncharacterized protein n=1 Tax=Xylaria hypoxylon TaxID=37992 RepID=A0A4Z0YMF8_9PEZI|nr:hypothetical protein E0Z10_g3816 [Xylaria hypoxylon]